MEDDTPRIWRQSQVRAEKLCYAYRLEGGRTTNDHCESWCAPLHPMCVSVQTTTIDQRVDRIPIGSRRAQDLSLGKKPKRWVSRRAEVERPCSPKSSKRRVRVVGIWERPRSSFGEEGRRGRRNGSFHAVLARGWLARSLCVARTLRRSARAGGTERPRCSGLSVKRRRCVGVDSERIDRGWGGGVRSRLWANRFTGRKRDSRGGPGPTVGHDPFQDGWRHRRSAKAAERVGSSTGGREGVKRAKPRGPHGTQPDSGRFLPWSGGASLDPDEFAGGPVSRTAGLSSSPVQAYLFPNLTEPLGQSSYGAPPVVTAIWNRPGLRCRVAGPHYRAGCRAGRRKDF